MAIRGTILVADDEVLARQSLVEALYEEGYHVHEAADGTTALKLLDEGDEESHRAGAQAARWGQEECR